MLLFGYVHLLVINMWYSADTRTERKSVDALLRPLPPLDALPGDRPGRSKPLRDPLHSAVSLSLIEFAKCCRPQLAARNASLPRLFFLGVGTPLAAAVLGANSSKRWPVFFGGERLE